MLSSEDSSAICVQRFDGSRNSAIHTTYRISLRSSSLREPRYPLLRVVFVGDYQHVAIIASEFGLAVPKISAQLSGYTGCGKNKHDNRADNPRKVPLRGAIPRPASAGHRAARKRGTTGSQCGFDNSMILPQVHLRKPCYDFSFL